MKIIKKVSIFFAIMIIFFGVGQSFATNTTYTVTNAQNNNTVNNNTATNNTQNNSTVNNNTTNVQNNNTVTSTQNSNIIKNTEATEAPIITEEIAGELIKVKEDTKKEYQQYVDLYGLEAYGVTAYVLNKVRLYSIPFCFIGIAIGAIFQYVIGVRKLDLRDKGFHLVVAFITILVICQILPLVFAIVVRGWRG